MREQVFQKCPAFPQRTLEKHFVADLQHVEDDNVSRIVPGCFCRCTSPAPGPGLQQSEVQSAALLDDQLGVKYHGAALSEQSDLPCDLGEGGTQIRTPAGLEIRRTGPGEHDHPEAVPLGIELKITTVGHRLDGAGQHRLERRGQVHTVMSTRSSDALRAGWVRPPGRS